MSGTCGKWLEVEKYAQATGIPEDRVRKMIRDGEVLSKQAGGVEQAWLEDPGEQCNEAGGAASPPPDQQNDDPEPEVVEGRSLVSPLSGPQELALHTERAIGLVERSFNAFMMMHEEVVREKERLVELSRSGASNRERAVKDKQEEIDKLSAALREKEQEIADLRMLVEILEGRAERQVCKPGEMKGFEDERASVGDLMEDQLRYIMEDQMIRELLEE